MITGGVDPLILRPQHHQRMRVCDVENSESLVSFMARLGEARCAGRAQSFADRVSTARAPCLDALERTAAAESGTRRRRSAAATTPPRPFHANPLQ